MSLTRELEVERFETVASALGREGQTGVIEFESATPRPDLLGSKNTSLIATRSAAASPRISVMIPLVDEGWTKDEPIAVWVRLDAAGRDVTDARVQREIDEFLAAAKAGPLRVYAAQTLPEEVDMEGTNAFTIGAKRAMQEHGLVSPVGAVLATWPAPTKGPFRLEF